jgi:glycosyltransferase involved in cell wall biosynthesis
MKILVVSQYYDPEPIYIPASVARGLASRGHEVTVVTGFPNYPEGRIYRGFRQSLRRKQSDGSVTVIRTPLWISHSVNPIGRLLNYFSFALSSLAASLAIGRVDVIYVYATQMTPAIGPSLMRAVLGTPYVMHIQDLWPESVTGSSMVGEGRVSAVIGAVLTPWLKSLYRQASATIAIAPTMASMLVSRGVPASRIRMVFNWANEQALGAVDPHVQHAETKPLRHPPVRVVYAGNLGDHQDLETVIRAAKIIEPETALTLEIYGAGMASARLKALAEELDVRNLRFRGSVNADAMRTIYAESDFQLVTLRDRPIFRGTIPSKFQACLYNGTAVMTNVAGDVADLCVRESLGLTCEPGSVEAMAEMFRQASRTSAAERQQMAGNGRKYYEDHMSLEQGLDALEDILGQATLHGRESNRGSVV